MIWANAESSNCKSTNHWRVTLKSVRISLDTDAQNFIKPKMLDLDGMVIKNGFEGCW